MADSGEDEVPPPVPPKRRQTRAIRSMSDPNYAPPKPSKPPKPARSASDPRRTRSDVGHSLAERIRRSGVSDDVVGDPDGPPGGGSGLPPPVPSKKKSGRRHTNNSASMAATASAAAAIAAGGDWAAGGSSGSNGRTLSRASSTSSVGSAKPPPPPPPRKPGMTSRSNSINSASRRSSHSHSSSSSSSGDADADADENYDDELVAHLSRAASGSSSSINTAVGDRSTSRLGRKPSFSAVARSVVAARRETSMAKFCSTVRTSMLTVKQRSIKLETSFSSWLNAFEQMERDYVDGIRSVAALANLLETSKYKQKVGRKVRRSRFAEQSAPIIRKIIAFHEKLIAAFGRIRSNDTIGSTIEVLDVYAGTLKKLLWVQIPYANAYAPAVAALQQMAHRQEVSE